MKDDFVTLFKSDYKGAQQLTRLQSDLPTILSLLEDDKQRLALKRLLQIALCGGVKEVNKRGRILPFYEAHINIFHGRYDGETEDEFGKIPIAKRNLSILFFWFRSGYVNTKFSLGDMEAFTPTGIVANSRKWEFASTVDVVTPVANCSTMPGVMTPQHQNNYQAFQEAKATVAKLQADLEAAITRKEELAAALREELGLELSQPATATRRGRKAAGGATRAPRSLESVLMTSVGRKLGEAKAAGTKKAAALSAAIAQAEEIAKKRTEALTEDLKAKLTAKADEIFGKK